MMPKIKDDTEESSSEDEMMKEALQEATDTHFLKNSFFNDQSSQEEQCAHPSSSYSAVEKYDEFGVSEGFKDFVAKKLQDFLDRNIEMIEKPCTHKRTRKRKKNAPSELVGGIRLLRTSTSVLSDVNSNTSTDEHTCTPRKQNVNILTSKDHNFKCKEAAVDPEWILSKAETKFWSNKQKGTVYEYKKLPNGTLIEK